MIAHKHKHDIFVLSARAEEGRRVDENALPLPPGQARRHQHNAGTRCDAPGLAQRAHALRPDGGRIEAHLVEAPVDNADTLGGLGVTLAHDSRGVLRVTDDGVAARHHAIVVRLESAALIVDAMVGGHEAALRSPGGDQRAPGRCATSSMHEADAPLPDDARKPQGIEHHQTGVFRSGGEADQFAACIGQLFLHSSAGRHNKGQSSAKCYRFGDFDRRPLGSPGRKLGDDLQNDRPRISI